MNIAVGPKPSILNSGSVSRYAGMYDMIVFMLQIHARKQQSGILFELMV
jgi:hypothetical protein